MSRPFELNPIRKAGPGGVIESIGLQWVEEASWRPSLWPMMILSAIPAAIFIVLVGVWCIHWYGNWLVLLAGIGLCTFIVRYMTGPLPKRGVVLKRNGQILVPYGTPVNAKWRSLKARQQDVVGFEIGPAFGGMQNDWTSTVQAVTQSGVTVTLSKFLHREEAREIVVGLNLALAQMRRSVGNDPAYYAGNTAQFEFVD